MSGLTTLIKISYYVDGCDSGPPQVCYRDVPSYKANSEHGCDWAWAQKVAAGQMEIHTDRVQVVDIDNIG